jgi:hypothetical protein
MQLKPEREGSVSCCMVRPWCFPTSTDTNIGADAERQQGQIVAKDSFESLNTSFSSNQCSEILDLLVYDGIDAWETLIDDAFVNTFDWMLPIERFSQGIEDDQAAVPQWKAMSDFAQ